MATPEPIQDKAPKDFGEVTLDRLFAVGGIESDPLAPHAPPMRRLPLWTRAYLRLLGTTSAADESPNRNWREYLIDAFIFSAIVVLLVWIAYLTWRAWGIFIHR
jgi:hypothetical protein